MSVAGTRRQRIELLLFRQVITRRHALHQPGSCAHVAQRMLQDPLLDGLAIPSCRRVWISEWSVAAEKSYLAHRLRAYQAPTPRATTAAAMVPAKAA